MTADWRQGYSSGDYSGLSPDSLLKQEVDLTACYLRTAKIARLCDWQNGFLCGWILAGEMGRQLGNGIILLPDSQQFLIFVVHLYQLGSMRYRLQGVRVLAMACAIVAWASIGHAQRPEIIHIQQVQAWDQADNDTLYVLNFWATWCKPCVAEMPYFDQVQRELEEQKVKVIFISMDFSNEYEKRLVPFVARKKLYSKVVMLDEPKYNDWIDLVSPAWSGAIPATLMVQHSRGIREFHEGEYTYESLKSKIESLINQ